jgi:hypothetical protein
MFAPPVAKPEEKSAAPSNNKSALHRSPSIGHRHGDGSVAEALALRPVPRDWASSSQSELGNRN